MEWWKNQVNRLRTAARGQQEEQMKMAARNIQYFKEAVNCTECFCKANKGGKLERLTGDHW